MHFCSFFLKSHKIWGTSRGQSIQLFVEGVFFKINFAIDQFFISLLPSHGKEIHHPGGQQDLKNCPSVVLLTPTRRDSQDAILNTERETGPAVSAFQQSGANNSSLFWRVIVRNK